MYIFDLETDIQEILEDMIDGDFGEGLIRFFKRLNYPIDNEPYEKFDTFELFYKFLDKDEEFIWVSNERPIECIRKINILFQLSEGNIYDKGLFYSDSILFIGVDLNEKMYYKHEHTYVISSLTYLFNRLFNCHVIVVFKLGKKVCFTAQLRRKNKIRLDDDALGSNFQSEWIHLNDLKDSEICMLCDLEYDYLCKDNFLKMYRSILEVIVKEKYSIDILNEQIKSEQNLDDNIGIYFNDLKIREQLSIYEEILLFKKFENGCVKSREFLIENNLKLVIGISKKYNNCGLDLIDLIQEGNIALMRAIDKFDYRKGFRFSTYAHSYIDRFIQRAIKDKGKIIRLPVHICDSGSKDYNYEIVALEDINTTNDDGYIENNIEDEQLITPVEYAELKDIKMRLLNLIETLLREDRDREIIKSRFGIGNNSVRTLETIGKDYGVTRERIRQIESKSLGKLKNNKYIKYLKEYWQKDDIFHKTLPVKFKFIKVEKLIENILGGESMNIIEQSKAEKQNNMNSIEEKRTKENMKKIIFDDFEWLKKDMLEYKEILNLELIDLVSKSEYGKMDSVKGKCIELLELISKLEDLSKEFCEFDVNYSQESVEESKSFQFNLGKRDFKIIDGEVKFYGECGEFKIQQDICVDILEYILKYENLNKSGILEKRKITDRFRDRILKKHKAASADVVVLKLMNILTYYEIIEQVGGNGKYNIKNKEKLQGFIKVILHEE